MRTEISCRVSRVHKAHALNPTYKNLGQYGNQEIKSHTGEM